MALGSVNVPGAFGLELKEADRTLEARMASVEKTLSGNEKIPGSVPPTSQVTARVGQIYINVITGEQWKCVSVSSSGTAWEKLTGSGTALSAADVGAVSTSDKGKPNGVATLDNTGKVPETQLPPLAPFIAQASAPADRTKLWIDTTANTGGLKYWNGSAWVHVPVAYT